MAMEYTRRGCRRSCGLPSHCCSGCTRSTSVPQGSMGGLNAVATLGAWLYFSSAAAFIGGEANSEIEKTAAEASHPDVRGTA